MLEDELIVSNIQRFSLHDGPGIRTTVFLKGCNLHCPWCSNPENIFPSPQTYIKDGNTGIYGKRITLSEIYSEVIKDKIYYDEDGGITFSGGEPLLFTDKLEPLFKKLKEENYHLCVETALFINSEKLDIALNYIDDFIVDAKIFDENICCEVLGGDISKYLSNLIKLSKIKKIVLRIPLISPYTTSDININEIITFLKTNNITPKKIELIKGHKLGQSKYNSLSMLMCDVPDLSEQELVKIQSKFLGSGFIAEICKI